MFLLASKSATGAYAVVDERGENVLFLFEEEDDAERYLGLLWENDENHKKLNVVEVDDELAMKACDAYNYKYCAVSYTHLMLPTKRIV